MFLSLFFDDQQHTTGSGKENTTHLEVVNKTWCFLTFFGDPADTRHAPVEGVLRKGLTASKG